MSNVAAGAAGGELGLGTDGQRHRLDVGHIGRHRLQQGPGRRHDDPQRRAQATVVGVGQPAQQHQARADGVDAGRQPLVGQRLPGREHRDRFAEHATQLGRQVVGLPAGRGDHEQRARLRERGGDEHPRTCGSDDGEVDGPFGGAASHFLQGGVA